MLFFLGIGLFVMGVLAQLFERDNRARRFRALYKGDAAAEDLVELEGTVVPGPLGTVRAPVSGREVVWFRILVEETRQVGETETFETVTLIDESDSRGFYLDDSRGRARIEPKSARVIVTRERIGAGGLFREPTPELERFLSSRGHESANERGYFRKLTCHEERLHPSDRLFAIGQGQRLALPLPAEANYRAPQTELVLASSVDGRERVLLTTHSRGGGGFRSRLAGVSPVGFVLCLAGIALVAHAAR